MLMLMLMLSNAVVRWVRQRAGKALVAVVVAVAVADVWTCPWIGSTCELELQIQMQSSHGPYMLHCGR